MRDISRFFFVLSSNRRSKLIPVNQHPLVIRVRGDLARYLLDRYADLNRLVTQKIGWVEGVPQTFCSAILPPRNPPPIPL
jgi:hypothetical protein